MFSSTMTRLLLLASIPVVMGATGFGYIAGVKIEAAKWQAKEHTRIVKAEQERDAAVDKLKQTQEEYLNALDTIRGSERRIMDTQRVRQQAERQAAIARGNLEAVRAYADGTTDLFESCREEYIDMGHEAARASAAAYALRPQRKERTQR